MFKNQIGFLVRIWFVRVLIFFLIPQSSEPPFAPLYGLLAAFIHVQDIILVNRVTLSIVKPITFVPSHIYPRSPPRRLLREKAVLKISTMAMDR